MAANQAKEVTVKNVQVVPSRNIPQGLSAMLAFNPDGEVDAVAEKMNKSLDLVKAGEITIATRSVEIDGVSVEQGQVIALLDGNLVCSTKSVEEGCLCLLEKANAKEHELITLFYGEELTTTEANLISDKVREAYPGQEIEVQDGGQPHYQFIISVE
jgi:dihydroxyacetone kinase-like predicted kinase